MILHETRVADTKVARRGTDTASRLLHDDGEDEAMVYQGLRRNCLDPVVDRADFVRGVIGWGSDADFGVSMSLRYGKWVCGIWRRLKLCGRLDLMPIIVLPLNITLLIERDLPWKVATRTAHLNFVVVEPSSSLAW